MQRFHASNVSCSAAGDESSSSGINRVRSPDLNADPPWRVADQGASSSASRAVVSLLPRILFRILDALCCGAILLDSRKTPIHLNDRARKCLGESLSIRNGRLCATDRTCDALFQTVLDQSLKYGATQTHWRRGAVALKQPERRALIARVVPVEGEAQAQLDGAALIVLLIDPDDCPQPSPDILRQVFDFTKTEGRIATQLLCGQTMHEVAAQNGVSIATVRSQTKAIFAKTQTNRQAQLIGLLTRLALISDENPTQP